ncbi:PHD finger and BAH domain protein (Snt2) [Pseudohyphozyma bogoriensis]|nr:PHD finger and BAH domain protein (Snt2) [Pseudohyphozyma bogoriensis]
MPPRKAALSPSPQLLSVDGKVLQVHDHVFVSPPWSTRDGEPYLIARIIAILPSTSPSSHASTSKHPSSLPRLRVAYYLRPRDITNRYVADYRLVVATMHTDVVPAEFVRGVCTVKHKESVKDMDAYRKGKDRFYWTQLYDRYLRRYFDAIPTDKIQNAPPEVVAHLVANFDHILCEVGMGPELCDAQRGCTTCHKWAANPESITCAHCRHIFHLRCLDPPLSQKPKSGYSWVCAPCSKAHEEEVEEFMEKGVRKGKDAEGKGKAEVQEEESNKIRSYHGWPFRYFGMHTDAASVLDPHDSLYPRASTRLGNKFQTTVPAWDAERGCQANVEQGRQYYFQKRSRTGTPVANGNGKEGKEVKARGKTKGKARALDVEADRGEDAVVQLLIKDGISDETLDSIVSGTKKLPVYNQVGVDLIDHALSLAEPNIPASETLQAVENVTVEDLGHFEWTVQEHKELAGSAKDHGNDLVAIRTELDAAGLDVEMRDVVLRYYMMIGHTMKEEVPQQAAGTLSVVTRRAAKAASPSDDNGSICGAAPSAAAKKARMCSICDGQQSGKWWKCPAGLGEKKKPGVEHVMCELCSFRWRHYGLSYAPTPEETAAFDWTSRKRAKTTFSQQKPSDSLRIRLILV